MKVDAKHRNKTHHNMVYDLNEYVGYSASEDFFQSMYKMKFTEIIDLKETLESMIMLLSEGGIYN